MALHRCCSPHEHRSQRAASLDQPLCPFKMYVHTNGVVPWRQREKLNGEGTLSFLDARLAALGRNGGFANTAYSGFQMGWATRCGRCAPTGRTTPLGGRPDALAHCQLITWIRYYGRRIQSP